jgi:ubiquitin carboxyl-terminal hydrolase 48
MFTDNAAFNETANGRKCIPLDDIMCIHQRLDPNKMDNFKRFSEVRTLMNRGRADFDSLVLQHASLRIAVDTDYEFQPTFTPTDVCRDCVEETFRGAYG